MTPRSLLRARRSDLAPTAPGFLTRSRRIAQYERDELPGDSDVGRKVGHGRWTTRSVGRIGGVAAHRTSFARRHHHVKTNASSLCHQDPTYLSMVSRMYVVESRARSSQANTHEVMIVSSRSPKPSSPRVA